MASSLAWPLTSPLTLGTSSAAETFLAPAVAEGVLDFNGTFLTSLEAVFEAKGFLAAAGEALAVLAAEAAVGLLKADEREAVVDIFSLEGDGYQ